MKIILVLSFVGFAITGCALTESVVEDTSRDVAKGAVNSVIEQKFPGVDAAPYTDCIIDNATTDEIFSLAKDAVFGYGDAAISLVLEIAGRPATSRCFARNALRSVLG